jgi:hypothetical protein
MSAYAYYPTANSGGGTDVALSVALGGANGNVAGADSRNNPNQVVL